MRSVRSVVTVSHLAVSVNLPFGRDLAPPWRSLHGPRSHTGERSRGGFVGARTGTPPVPCGTGTACPPRLLPSGLCPAPFGAFRFRTVRGGQLGPGSHLPTIRHPGIVWHPTTPGLRLRWPDRRGTVPQRSLEERSHSAIGLRRIPDPHALLIHALSHRLHRERCVVPSSCLAVLLKRQYHTRFGLCKLRFARRALCR
jgi:hypothetical protein